MPRTIVAFCLALAPLVATATIYKVRMPDGTILFTDKPPRNGKVLEQREATPVPTVRPPARTPAPPAARPPASGVPAAAAGRAPSETGEAPPTLDGAMAEITEAERDLALARRALEAGQEPQPGERIGLAKGGSRLSPAYESRVAELERAVAVAEARVRRAYEARNALR